MKNIVPVLLAIAILPAVTYGSVFWSQTNESFNNAAKDVRG